MTRKKTDMEKHRYWEKVIGEAARSGVSIREFCRQRRLDEHQFYWWRHRLGQKRQQAAVGQPAKRQPALASFALVSAEQAARDAGIELVLDGGRRLRISKGVDEATLRAVLDAIDSPAKPAGARDRVERGRC